MGSSVFQISLEIQALGVARAGRDILAGVSCSLAPGEALVLRGANGAGKTSLLRAIAGFARIQEGSITFSDSTGEIGHEDAAAYHLHYLGHENGISTKLSVNENLRFWSDLLQHGSGKLVEEIVAQVGLRQMAAEKALRLSAGQKRRLALARLLIAPRAMWLMDEPATALDTDGQALLLDLCHHHRARGGTIVLTTHGGFTLPDAKGLQLVTPGNAT